MRLIAGVASAALALPATVAKGESAPLYVFDTLALAGDAAPGTSDGFTSFGDPVLNEVGEVAFLAFVGPAMRQGIFKGSGGTLTKISLAGEPVPGAADTFERFGRPVLNGSGEVAFRGVFGTASPPASGIFKHSEGILAEVALVGASAPGTTQTFAAFGDPVLNGAGDTAFLALVGPTTVAAGRLAKEGRSTLPEVVFARGPVRGRTASLAKLSDSLVSTASRVALVGLNGAAVPLDSGIFKESGGSSRR